MRGFNPTNNHSEATSPESGPQFRRPSARDLRPRRGGPHGRGRETFDDGSDGRADVFGRGGRGPGGRGPGGRGGPGGRHRHGDEHNHERGPRRPTRRGEIKTVLLAILAEGPGHGYELMQRIEEKTSGAWKPSPGSVYPTLQFLEDEGLVAATTSDGKRTYELTESGQAEAKRRIDSPTENPWTRDGRGQSDARSLFEPMKGLVIALKQISNAGTPEQILAAGEIVKDARKKLYLLLAAD
jgi:DNA-binding PadR family transcriptional regulator